MRVYMQKFHFNKHRQVFLVEDHILIKHLYMLELKQ